MWQRGKKGAESQDSQKQRKAGQVTLQPSSGEEDALPARWTALVSMQRHGAGDGRPGSWLLLLCGALDQGLEP